MADANPSRPTIDQTAGKLQINIPKGQKVVKNKDGNYVRRTEFQSGTIRETQVYPGDDKLSHPANQPTPAPKSIEQLRAEIRTEILAEMKVEELGQSEAAEKAALKAKMLEEMLAEAEAAKADDDGMPALDSVTREVLPAPVLTDKFTEHEVKVAVKTNKTKQPANGKSGGK